MSTTIVPQQAVSGRRSEEGLRRRALLVDALGSAAAGAVLLVGAAWLDTALGVPAWFLAVLGTFFLAFAAGVASVAGAGAPVGLVRLIGGGNLVWGALSAGVLAADVLTPTTAGLVVGVVQAAFVVVVGDLQLWSARRR